METDPTRPSRGTRQRPARLTGDGASDSEAEALSAAIGATYDAALDPGMWPAALREICKFLDCAYAAVGSADLIRNDLNFIVTWGYPAGAWELYLERYHHTNPFNAPAFRTRIGDIIVGSRHDTYPAFLASDFYREFAEPLGMIDAIQATVDRSASGIALLTCVRHRDAGIATDTQIRRMGLIAPHVRRAILIGGLIDRHVIQATAFVNAIDRLDAGVFMVNPNGVMIHANRSGEAMIADGDPIRIVNGGALAAIDPAANRALATAIAAAAEGDAGVGVAGMAMMLPGTEGRTFMANLLPLAAGQRREAARYYSAAAALFVREAKLNLDTAIGAATQLYELTPAEVRVIRAVVEVGGVPQIATLLGTTRATVRTQLQAIFKKTATRRQAELVGLISGHASRA